jgi:hypothetical protein
MAGRDKVDIVATLVLQFEHNNRQFFRLDLLTDVCLADIMVLAELAVKVAASEKDGAGPAPASKRIFLAHMRPIAADFCPNTGTAYAEFSGTAIDWTIPGAHVAYR